MASLTTPGAAETDPLPPPTSYTLAQLLTRNRRRQYVTKDGRFQLRRAGRTEHFYWHELAKKDGKTVVGNPISGPDGSFCTSFCDKPGALAILNTICADYHHYRSLFR